MPEVVELGWNEVYARAMTVAEQISGSVAEPQKIRLRIPIFGVPNGGIPAAQAILHCLQMLETTKDRGVEFCLSQSPQVSIIVDDIVDSGATRAQFMGKHFHALVDKQTEEEFQGKWVSFPWERMQKQDGPHENIVRLLQYIGEDPKRPGLKETPKRIVESYKEIYSGYKQQPADCIKVFEESTSDAMVLLKDVEFYSRCEHHMEPFFGRAHLAYIPSAATDIERFGGRQAPTATFKVLGVSKLARLFDVFARRLQIQERLCDQFVQFLMNSELKPLGVACIVDAVHFCVCGRGVGKQNSRMVTSSVEGVFRDKPEVRAEFFSLVKS